MPSLCPDPSDRNKKNSQFPTPNSQPTPKSQFPIPNLGVGRFLGVGSFLGVGFFGSFTAALDRCARVRYNLKFRSLIVPSSCGSGGTGRRASLRSLWPQGRGGSNPLFRTITARGPILLALFVAPHVRANEWLTVSQLSLIKRQKPRILLVSADQRVGGRRCYL